MHCLPHPLVILLRVLFGAGLLLAVGGLIVLAWMSRKIVARRKTEGKPPQRTDGKFGLAVTAIGLFAAMFLGLFLLMFDVDPNTCENIAQSTTILWILGVCGSIASHDSKLRWPGSGITERIVKIFSFSRD